MLQTYLGRIYTPQLYFIGLCLLLSPLLFSAPVGLCAALGLGIGAYLCDLRTFQSVPNAFKTPDEKEIAKAWSLMVALFASLFILFWGLVPGTSPTCLLIGFGLKMIVPTGFAVYAFRTFELEHFPFIQKQRELDREEREKKRHVQETRIQLRQFYDTHFEELREHVPPALFRARMSMAIHDASSPEEAARASAKLLEKLNTIVRQVRELRKQEEERRKKNQPPPVERLPAQAVIDDVIAELNMGLSPDVIARSLGSKKVYESQQVPQTLDQHTFHTR